MPNDAPLEVNPVEPVSPDAELTAPPPDPEPEPAVLKAKPASIVPVFAQPLPIVELAPEQPFKVVAGVNFSIGSGGSVAKL